jgi:hypothetical protein
MLDGERIIFDGQRHVYSILCDFARSRLPTAPAYPSELHGLKSDVRQTFHAVYPISIVAFALA